MGKRSGVSSPDAEFFDESAIAVQILLLEIVEQALAENPRAVDDVKSGGKKSKKARGFLLGQVMQKTKGQANPKVASEILDEKLK